MKFALDKAHRDFFKKEGWIEFTACIPKNKIVQLSQSIQSLDQSDKTRSHPSPNELFFKGRDLWRSHPSIRKFVMQPYLAEIAAELVEKRPLRLGYDQLLPVVKPSNFNFDAYTNWLDREASLESVSCLREIACGIILNLNASELANTNIASSADIDFFSKALGNATFVHPKLPIKWRNLYKQVAGSSFYLIVYTGYSAQYYLQPDDPHTYALKRIGYGVNDTLNDRLNPIVLR